MARYFKRKWEEGRGGAYDSWGHAVYFFEVDEQLYPVRQMEVYDNGHVLKYDHVLRGDAHGMLSDRELDGEDFGPFEISGDEFAEEWGKRKAFNA